MRAIAIVGCASVLSLGAVPVPVQAYEDWGQHGRWTYAIDTGCTMHAMVSDKVRASVELRTIGDELLVKLYDERWPREALKAMTEGQDYRATMTVDRGLPVVASARRDKQWGFITLTTQTDQLEKMGFGRTLRYHVGNSAVAGEFAIGLTDGALKKHRECDREADRRMDEMDGE